MKSGVTGVTLDDLIEAALTEKKYNEARLGKEIERYAGRVSAARAPELPEDIREEVAQETIIVLLRMGREALLRLGPRKLLRTAVFEAIRVVRTNYTPPGRPTQPSKKKKPGRVAAETVTSVVTSQQIRQITIDDGSGPYVDFDLLPSSAAAAEFDRAENRIDVQKLLAGAPPLVTDTLRAIHFEDVTLKHLAAKANMSRFALDRRLDAFYETVRLAA